MSHSGAHQTATSQKGVLPKLGRDDGVYPRASIPKRYTWSHPTFDQFRSPAIHSRKQKKTLDGWEEPREHDKRCRFSFGVDLTENMDVAIGESLCLPFCQGFGGCTPFFKCSFLALVLRNALRRWRSSLSSVHDIRCGS